VPTPARGDRAREAVAEALRRARDRLVSRERRGGEQGKGRREHGPDGQGAEGREGHRQKRGSLPEPVPGRRRARSGGAAAPAAVDPHVVDHVEGRVGGGDERGQGALLLQREAPAPEARSGGVEHVGRPALREVLEEPVQCRGFTRPSPAPGVRFPET